MALLNLRECSLYPQTQPLWKWRSLASDSVWIPPYDQMEECTVRVVRGEVHVHSRILPYTYSMSARKGGTILACDISEDVISALTSDGQEYAITIDSRGSVTGRVVEHRSAVEKYLIC